MAEERDLTKITEIYNYAIEKTTATFDTNKVSVSIRKQWFLDHGRDYPIIIAEVDGKTVGYGSLSQFRPKPAYRQTVENSIYVDPSYQGRKIGGKLLEEVIRLAKERNYHSIIAVITGGNKISIALHAKYGFVHKGTIEQGGYKFGRWLDVDFYQLFL